MTRNANSGSEGHIKRIVFWETISIREEDERVVHVVNGQARREYSVNHSDYNLVMERIMGRYPEMVPGRICSYQRYSDGSEKVEIRNLEGEA